MASRTSALDYRRKVGTLTRVRAACRRAQRAGKIVVFTNGCFDLLHPGHVRYLALARSAGDLLVVALNGDRSVRRLKGPGRPIQDERSRAEVLAALACVDHVVVFDADTPIAEIEAIAPDVLAKGADWPEDAIAGADVVRARGGRVLRVPLVEGQSTTRIVARSRAPRSGVRPRRRPGSTRTR